MDLERDGTTGDLLPLSLYMVGRTRRCESRETMSRNTPAVSSRAMRPRVYGVTTATSVSLVVAGVCSISACADFKPGSDVLVGGSGTEGVFPLIPDEDGLGDGAQGWGCLDVEPEAEDDSPATVSYTVTLVDSITNQPPEGLTVQVCDDVDLSCARPISSQSGVSPDGRVRLSMAPGFDGFFEIYSETTVPTRLYPDGLLVDDVDGRILELVDEAALVGLATAAGVALDQDSGLVLARAFDCDGDLSRGVAFRNDAQSRAFSFIDGLPIEGAVTGPEGLVVFTNVPRGFTLIEGTLSDTGSQMGSTSAEVVPGWVIYADIRPPP